MGYICEPCNILCCPSEAIQSCLVRQLLPWLLLPLHHLCGFLSCYSVIESFWGFNGRFTYYRWNLTLSLNHLSPLYAGP